MQRTWMALSAGSVITLALCLGTALSAPGGGPLKSDARVKVKVKSDKSAGDNTETIAITLAVDKGWHVYANPVGLEDLASAQTVVLFTGSAKPEVLKIDYPAGKLVKDSIVGDHKVYEDQVTIRARVRRAAGPLTVAVKFQACSDKTCLQAATVKTTLP